MHQTGYMHTYAKTHMYTTFQKHLYTRTKQHVKLKNHNKSTTWNGQLYITREIKYVYLDLK